ncbi:MAG: hypothetical protein M1819_005494 [Sarea resinae]|nr:MAG: hypothetical protein M1819_005494 [Sarea resinae]
MALTGPSSTARGIKATPRPWLDDNPCTRRQANSLPWILLLCCLFVRQAAAAFINFDNCLNPNIINSNPLQLQFVPLHLYASFNKTNPSHNLNVTVYGNVSGIATQQTYPSPNSPQWSDPNATVGKIVDLSKSNNVYSTFFSRFNVLSYTPYDADPMRFCETLVHGECPLGPAFTANASLPSELPAFSVAHQFYSSYAFATFSATLRATSGDANKAELVCVSASITPDLGANLTNVLRFLPLAILILVGFATAFAAIWSPWGSSDTFRWTSNYGRDTDLLRLVTPGFGDCLQYIQFIVLTGSLSLNYPGYYQPVVSKVSWSALMFNESFVSHGNGTQSLIDGIYVYNGTYGLDRVRQLVGMTSVKDIWAGMVIWLLVILAAMVVLIQIGFVFRWGYRFISNIQEEDLRAKNLPFTIGNVIRVVFNYFLLPIVALSTFQLVVASQSKTSTVGLAALLLIALFGFAGWLLFLVARTRPRSYLFDDLPTVLLYGPLYNTYSDDKAPFALIPVLLTFLRGIAIGAVQPSGIAQVILLAICEVIFILTLHAFKPFLKSTSMNAYHTAFSLVRLLATLLSVAFIPSLGVTEAPRGWIGYIILLLHAIVLIFGYLLNALQTIVEVGARLAGAGGDESMGGAAARGGLVKVFGMRQLSRRLPRRDHARHSGTSDAAMLSPDIETKSPGFGSRPRSMSGSSAILLNQHTASDGRQSVALESLPGTSHHRQGSGSASYTPDTPRAASAFSYLPSAGTSVGPAGPSGRGAILGIKTSETADPYYRPPRPRRPTLEAYSPGARSRGSWASGDWPKNDDQDVTDAMEGPSISGRATPVPAYLGSGKEQSDSNVNEPRRSKTDYAVRESDFYYGVRGPALSNQPTRRLKTGPADPTGTVSSAAGWFKGLFGGKTKEKGKGFEVVRSSRAPPPLAQRAASGTPAAVDVPYRDDPEAEAQPQRRHNIDSSDEEEPEEITRAMSDDEVSSLTSDEEEEAERTSTIPEFPPSLPSIDTGGGIEMPSRVGSKASSQHSRRLRRVPPSIPRKSSRRKSSGGDAEAPDFGRLSTIQPSPPSSPRGLYDAHQPSHTLRPSTAESDRLPFRSEPSSVSGPRLSTGGSEASSAPLEQANPPARQTSVDRPSSIGYVQHHRTSVHLVSPDEPSHIGSRAELVEVPREE